jgi:hypothetical protein
MHRVKVFTLPRSATKLRLYPGEGCVYRALLMSDCGNE